MADPPDQVEGDPHGQEDALPNDVAPAPHDRGNAIGHAIAEGEVPLVLDIEVARDQLAPSQPLDQMSLMVERA